MLNLVYHGNKLTALNLSIRHFEKKNEKMKKWRKGKQQPLKMFFLQVFAKVEVYTIAAHITTFNNTKFWALEKCSTKWTNYKLGKNCHSKNIRWNVFQEFDMLWRLNFMSFENKEKFRSVFSGKVKIRTTPRNCTSLPTFRAPPPRGPCLEPPTKKNVDVHGKCYHSLSIIWFSLSSDIIRELLYVIGNWFM